MDTLNKRLIQLQMKSGLKKKDIAAAAGLSIMGYYRYETGERQPTADTITRLCKIFNVSADYLLGLSDEYTVLSSEASRGEEAYTLEHAI